MAISLSVTTRTMNSYSFISYIGGLTSVLNLTALLRFRKHILLCDSKTEIIRVESIPARVNPQKEITVSIRYLLIFNRSWGSMFLI